jgi:hypothetical protein
MFKFLLGNDKKYDKAWKDGGLVGINVGKKQERERILAIFNDLNAQSLSKQDFTATFINRVGE